MSDDVAVVGGSEARADAEQGVEGRCGVAAAVPAEHELVEIAVQMGAAQAMEGSERPALQVREHTMDPDQHEMGGRCTDDLGLVVVVGQARITAFRTVKDPTTGGQGRSRQGKMRIAGAVELSPEGEPRRIRLALQPSVITRAPAPRSRQRRHEGCARRNPRSAIGRSYFQRLGMTEH